MKPPPEDDVLSWFSSLSNWGRWGPDDARGTLNLITPEVRRRAAQLVREGVRVSCSWDIEPRLEGPVHRFMTYTGEGLADEHRVKTEIPFHESEGDRGAWASDYIMMPVHYQTHVDALCHMFWDGRMYNGKPAEWVNATLGATTSDIRAASEGVFTRGVLIDVAEVRGVDWLENGQGVFPEDLEAAEQRIGVRVGEGDALLLRTGFSARKRAEPELRYEFHGQPGFHASCLPWLHERGVAVTACDSAHDILPSGYKVMSLPVHYIGITAMGLWTIDSCDLEGLASLCADLERWEFLFTFDPLRIVGATGSPVNPVATF